MRVFFFAAAAAAAFPRHDWSTGRNFLWADWAPNPDSPDWPLSAAALADVATRYRVHSLEQCFGCPWGAPCNASEAHVITAARGMKAAAAAVGAPPPVVLMYVQGSMPRSCFASDAEYMRNPEWFLRFDAHAWAGQPVLRTPRTPRLDDNTFLDYTNAPARAWWGAQAWAQPGARGAIDGVYADSIGWQNWHNRFAANISWDLTYALNNATLQMLGEAKAAWGYQVMYNGLEVDDRYAPQWNDGALAVTDGADIEHWGAFECILPNGSMNVSMFAAVILQAFARGNDGSGKGIFIKGWPGPVVAPIFFLPEDAWGPHRMTPSWPMNNTPLTAAARSQALLDFYPFVYATFLMAAGPQTYLHYSWWYDLCDGTSPVCKLGRAWADLSPLLGKRTGAPLGAPAVSGAVFSRAFEGVNVSVNLSEWTSAVFSWAPTVAIEVHAVVLGVPVAVYSASVPLGAGAPTISAFAAMTRAAEDPQALVFDQRPIGGHPFVISIGPLPCTRERCWFFSVNGNNGTVPVDEATLTAGDVLRWDYLAL